MALLIVSLVLSLLAVTVAALIAKRMFRKWLA
jgi:hypothetical protein